MAAAYFSVYVSRIRKGHSTRFAKRHCLQWREPIWIGHAQTTRVFFRSRHESGERASRDLTVEEERSLVDMERQLAAESGDTRQKDSKLSQPCKAGELGLALTIPCARVLSSFSLV